ncbi:MAG TPA: hypothetical protein VJ695_02605 [Nitrososphaera sp.]|nr:hypothetical protein [Nitrososphaera sp.]
MDLLAGKKASSLSIIIVIPLFTVLALISTNAYGQGMGHNLPQSNIAGREVFLSFNAPPIADPSEEVDISLSFMDKTTGKNVNHVTYFLTISNPQGNQTFSEVLHGHDGTVKLQFKPGESQYRVNANYDNLAASYVPDQAGIITVSGPVFVESGTYTVNIEVNGIDYDNTFLPEPITYQYPLAVSASQKFPVSYETMNFNVNVSSPVSVQNVTLKPESKQLIIKYPNGEWQHLDNFQVYVDIPKQMMMSEPFTAMFNGMVLNVSQVQSDNTTTSLLLNGSHLDMMEMENQTSEGVGSMQEMDMGQTATQVEDTQQNAIVITAATVVPEFPPSLSLVATAAGFSVIVFFFSQKRIRFSN